MIECVAPAPVTEYIAPSPAVSYPSSGLVNQQFSITADETSQVHVAIRGIPEIPVAEWIQEQSTVPELVIPQISPISVEASQVVGSFSLLEDFAAPVYNQVNQEQIVTAVQAQAIVQEIPEVFRLWSGYRSPSKCFHMSVCNSTPQYKLCTCQRSHNFLLLLLRSLIRFLSRICSICRNDERAPRRPASTNMPDMLGSYKDMFSPLAARLKRLRCSPSGCWSLQWWSSNDGV